VDERRVAEGEEDRLVLREEDVEVVVGEPCGLGRGLQLHEVHHVDDPDAELRRVQAEEIDGGERLERGHVATARHHVGPSPRSLLAHSQTPRPAVVLDRPVHRQPPRGGLLARDDDVDVVPAAQAVVGDGEYIGVGRQVHAHDLGLLLTTWSMKLRSWWLNPLCPPPDVRRASS
jgi:hypothetical protein